MVTAGRLQQRTGKAQVPAPRRSVLWQRDMSHTQATIRLDQMVHDQTHGHEAELLVLDSSTASLDAHPNLQECSMKKLMFARCV